MSIPVPSTLTVGSRIQVGNDRATIRFIGTVQGSKGEWLGVEWDDPNRGKHDGTHKETKYFQCKHPTSGSFIRYHPEKVKTGTTFMKALKFRYLEEDEITRVREGEDYDASKDHAELYFGGDKQIVVETVGFEKVQRSLRQLNTLKVVGLAEQLIQSAGEKDEITNSKLVIEDLDLSRNLISDWQTVYEIASQLPHLSILRLNQLRFSSPPPAPHLQLLSVKTLSLKQSLISWNDIQAILNVFPQLQDLQLGGNELSVLDEIKHNQLSTLNLEDNQLSDWKQVAHLGKLPNLKTLFLNNNQLKSIDEPTSGTMFSQLRFLRIDSNLIDNWTSIDALNKYKNLEILRCKNNPIFKDLDKEHEAAQIVGRIGHLTTVNGSTLTNREKIDLERYYLIQCAKDGTTHESIAKIHPRYKELCQLHGEPALQTQNKDTSTTLKDRLINITLSIRDSIPLEDIRYQKDLPAVQKTISKKFLRTMTIRNIKHLIQRLLKIPSTSQQLFLLQKVTEDKERDLIVMDISDDLRDLKFYGINDGDEILIFENV